MFKCLLWSKTIRIVLNRGRKTTSTGLFSIKIDILQRWDKGNTDATQKERDKTNMPFLGMLSLSNKFRPIRKMCSRVVYHERNEKKNRTHLQIDWYQAENRILDIKARMYVPFLCCFINVIKKPQKNHGILPSRA